MSSRPKQLSLNDIFTDCLESFTNDKPRFFTLLNENLNLDSLIPVTFWYHFYQHEGRPREYPLIAFIRALFIQRIFSIPTDSLLLIFLQYSREFREFCGFLKVPDASKITRFKQDFVDDLQVMFDHLVELTEPVCHATDAARASMTIFDTSGIEAYVQENNPKYADSIIKRLKAWKKAVRTPENYDPYKAAYASMPPYAFANPEVKQMYINGHFCYAHKFGMITNGLGIVRDIAFYDADYITAHPEIEVGKKSDTPDDDKSLADAKALIPTLEDFFKKHPNFKPGVFLGDSAFDSIDIYAKLLGEGGIGFEKAFIPLNERSSLSYPACPLNDEGIPCCPNDSALPMKPEGNTSCLQCSCHNPVVACSDFPTPVCETFVYVF